MIMKLPLLLLGSILFFLFLGQVSCTKSESNPSLPGNIDDYRILTPEEIAALPYKPGNVSGNLSQERTIHCAWADGLGGNMPCEGDHCEPIVYNPTGQVGLGCFQGTQLVSSGLYRN